MVKKPHQSLKLLSETGLVILPLLKECPKSIKLSPESWSWPAPASIPMSRNVTEMVSLGHLRAAMETSRDLHSLSKMAIYSLHAGVSGGAMTII